MLLVAVMMLISHWLTMKKLNCIGETQVEDQPYLFEMRQSIKISLLVKQLKDILLRTV